MPVAVECNSTMALYSSNGWRSNQLHCRWACDVDSVKGLIWVNTQK